MRMGTKVLSMVLAVSLLGIGGWAGGCKQEDSRDTMSGACGTGMCGKCGQTKGCDSSCELKQIKCSDCGLTKGSPDCCKISQGAETAEICDGCGQIEGSDSCCKPDQPKCAKCGLTKGSPGCCKIPEL